MTRSPFEPSPASKARAVVHARVMALLEDLTPDSGHRRRAGVRIAGLFPPTGPGPTDDDVRAAVTATAPKEHDAA